ncbi:hypothetical protein ACWCRF_34285 [Streptomyces sp. NPDC002405]
MSALLGPLVGGLTYTVLVRSSSSRQLDRVRQDRAAESARSTAVTSA